MTYIALIVFGVVKYSSTVLQCTTGLMRVQIRYVIHGTGSNVHRVRPCNCVVLTVVAELEASMMRVAVPYKCTYFQLITVHCSMFSTNSELRLHFALCTLHPAHMSVGPFDGPCSLQLLATRILRPGTNTTGDVHTVPSMPTCDPPYLDCFPLAPFLS